MYGMRLLCIYLPGKNTIGSNIQNGQTKIIGLQKEQGLDGGNNMNDEKLNPIVSPSPHIKSDDSTRGLMLDVIIALLPALFVSIYFFGWRVLGLTLISVGACIFFEWGYRRITKKNNSVGDLSAVVTGILLVFCLPVTTPYWTVVIGDFFAIVIVKQLFGGLGKNFMNPALAARAFMFSWPVIMSTWTAPGTALSFLGGNADVVTCATPLSFLRNGTLPDVGLFQLFLGNCGGSLGETCTVALLLGGIYLIIRRVISPRIPVAFIGTVALITFIFPQNGVERFSWMLAEVLSGGLILGAVFMATDYVTSPVTKKGQWIYGIGCGLITVFIRYFGSYVEGVSYAILIMNVCVYLIDKVCKPKRYGVTSKKGGCEQ